jgi:hypothetical protein
MILERVEKDDLVKVIYESSNVVASTYNKTNKNLNVIFKYGGSYTYQNVSATDYFRFETADSQGKELNTTIKKYAFLKHENVDTDDVVKKIKELKGEEVKAMELGLINLMTETVEHYNTTGGLSTPQVDRLEKMISVLINTKK